MKTIKGRLLSVLLVTFIFLWVGCEGQQFKTGLFSPFENQSMTGPNGLAWNGRDLIMGTLGQTSYARDIRTRGYYLIRPFLEPVEYYVSAKFPLDIKGNMRICGLAWEGACCEDGFLWVADAANKQILKVDSDHNVIHAIPSPGNAPKGLTFDGEYLWVADTQTSLIYQISTDDGSVKHSFDSPVKVPTGLAWDCTYLWVLGQSSCKRGQKDCVTARLLRVDLEQGVATHEINLPAMITRPSALEWINGVFWVGDYNSNRVFRLYDAWAREICSSGSFSALLAAG